MKRPEQGRQCLHSWGVYTFSGSCSSNHQALLLETLVSQAKQGSGTNIVPLRELHGLHCSLAAMATLSRRTSLATHLVRSRAEEPAEIHRIPGLDRNNSDNDNNNDNNSQRLLHLYEMRAGTTTRSLCKLTYLILITAWEVVTTVTTILQMKRWKQRRLRNLPKTRRLVGAQVGFKLGGQLESSRVLLSMPKRSLTCRF